MLTQNSIQARLRGDSLPTTIKQANPIVTNLGNIVAVKEYETHTILVAHHSVVELPITLVGDSIVHQAFDLTHWSRLVDSVSIAPIRAKVNPPNDHQNLWVSSGGLMVEFSTGLWKTIESFPQVLVFLWKTINIHNHHQISIFSVSLVCDPYFVL